MSNELEVPDWGDYVQGLPKLPPDPNQTVREAFAEYIAPHWQVPVLCPVCKTGSWTIINPTDLPFRYTSGYVLTLIPVMCDTCKYIMFFGATAAGLFDSEGNPVPHHDQ